MIRTSRTVVAEVVVTSTGSVGEEFAAFRRARRGKHAAPNRWGKDRRSSAVRANLRWQQKPEAKAWKREYMREWKRRRRAKRRAAR